MKILYVAKERSDAAVAARALRGIAKNVTVSWAFHLDHAADWIRENRDLAALVVEAQVDIQRCTSFLKDVRSLGLRAAVVVIVPEEAVPRLESLKPGAYDFVAKNQSLARNLPVVVARAIASAQTLDPGRWDDLPAETFAEPAAQGPLDTAVEPFGGNERRTTEATEQERAGLGVLNRRPVASDVERRSAEQRLGDLEASFRQREQGWAIEQLAAAERQTTLEGLLHQERATRANLEQELAHASAALRDAEQRHRSALTTAAEQLAERQAQYEAGMARAAATWDMVDEQLREAAIEVARARQGQASAEAEADRLSRLESERSRLLAEAVAIHSTLEGQLADARTALEAANERAARERLTAAQQQAELQTRLGQEVERRQRVEEQLAHAETARDDAEARHALAATKAATELAERQARFDAELAEAATTRDALAHQARDLDTALGLARQDLASHAAAIERLTQREAELASMLAEATTARTTIERRLAGTETAFKDADERATRERLAATKRAAEREAELDGVIRQERATRANVEQQLAQVEGVLRDAEQRHATAMTTSATERAERQAQFETELSQVASEVERLAGREAELTSRLADVAAARNTLELQLSDAAMALKDADQRAARERVATTERQLDVEARLAQEIHRRETLESRLAEMEEEARRAETEHRERREGLDRARLTAEAEVRRLAAEIEGLAARHSASLRAAESERAQRDVLQAEADRVPQLQKQLDESRAEGVRQFEQAPVAMCRCTRDGALVRANRAFAVLVGDRKVDELCRADFATTVFESPDDLSWLIERCLSTQAIESIETIWKGANGGRLVVRVSAAASASDVIEIVAEDLTNLRALQDRLGQAHRMEAVGRLASEVAVTCGNLLLDVRQDAQQWLTAVGGDTGLRQQSEMLLDELSRASGFLRQLAAYSDEETNALAPVDLIKVLGDLEPVLRRVAGDDVELELPKVSSPIEVDVKAGHVERLFVNLAGYGRERMPSGGRLKIELATVVVGRRFIEKYPNVRQGPHALITVTEVKRAMRANGLVPLRGWPTEQGSGSVASEKKFGVDLGALQGLIRECSGHLWMAVEPPGDMVVKMHLPMRTSGDRTPPALRRTR